MPVEIARSAPDYSHQHVLPTNSLIPIPSTSSDGSSRTSGDPIEEFTSLSLPPLVRSHSQPASNLNKFAKNYIIPAAKWAYSPIMKIRTREDKCVDSNYRIEYSVFKPVRNLPQIESDEDLLTFAQASVRDELEESMLMTKRDFDLLVERVIDVIENENIQPERIAQGSSGSYFVFNTKVIDRETGDVETYKVGVFKPKDEEPYGPLSPKWTKWMHRTFFPCFFGRSCLIPNLGYISEAAASVLDKQLMSYIVPYTHVVHLRSPSFYYSYWKNHVDIHKLSNKIGSFQIFLNGYTDAQTWFRTHPIPGDLNNLPESPEVQLNEDFRWSKEGLLQFREELEKLVILDYIMRNTDRGLDNWMIKVIWKNTKKGYKTSIIKIGAIDSGLAFPWKRPDEWRSFPFGWLFLPLSIIGQPFSMKTRRHYLTLLTSKHWWEHTVVKLREVFELDNDFKERMWHKQLAVLKGQAFNVVEILKLSYAGPLELTRRENLLVWDDVMLVPSVVNNDVLTNAMETSLYEFGEGQPLLSSPKLIKRKKSDYGSLLSNDDEAELTGYEYNQGVDEGSHQKRQAANQKVIIERLEKVDSKPPVFTWC